MITDPAVRPRVDAMLARVTDVAHATQVAAGRYAKAAEEVARRDLLKSCWQRPIWWP